MISPRLLEGEGATDMWDFLSDKFTNKLNHRTGLNSCRHLPSMAPPFLRRTSNLTCFFCLSAVSPAPVDSRSYRCPHCACWNRYDANGEIVSDEPAMHDENLNARSFAKRGSSPLAAFSLYSAAHSPPQHPRTRTDSRPRMVEVHSATHVKQTKCSSSTSSQIICHLHRQVPSHQSHTTTSTRTIVSQHPDYAQRVQQLPAYRESLHVRYPPVCVNCLPAVEDEIEQKNQMARTKALGGWLKESKGKERQRLVSDSGMDRERLGFQLAIWRVRGALWWTTLLCVLVAHAAGRQQSFVCCIPLISPQRSEVTISHIRLLVPFLYSLHFVFSPSFIQPGTQPTIASRVPECRDAMSALKESLTIS